MLDAVVLVVATAFAVAGVGGLILNQIRAARAEGRRFHRRSRMDAPVGARPERLVHRGLAVGALIRSHLWRQISAGAVPWFKGNRW